MRALAGAECAFSGSAVKLYESSPACWPAIQSVMRPRASGLKEELLRGIGVPARAFGVGSGAVLGAPPQAASKSMIATREIDFFIAKSSEVKGGMRSRTKPREA